LFSVFFTFLYYVLKLSIAKYLSNESHITVFKSVIESIVLLFENPIQNLVFEAGFQLFKHFCLLNQNSIKSKLFKVKILHSAKDTAWKCSIFENFVKCHDPIIYLLFLFIKLIFRLEITQQLLERSDHVAKYYNS